MAMTTRADDYAFAINNIPAGAENSTTITPVAASNVIGYYSGILVLGANPPTSFELSIYWRPIMDPTGAKGRWLPLYLDLESTDGAKPNYAIFNKVTQGFFSSANLYLYLVHPETPAAVPLLDDQTAAHRGLEIKVVCKNTSGSTASLTGTLYFLDTEEA